MILTALLVAMPAQSRDADDRTAVYGIWATSGTMIEVGPKADGSLSARIIALKHPNWREKDGVGSVGEPKTDLNNPDPEKRGRPLVGLEILERYEFSNGIWRGRLYLPTSGQTWSSTARVKKGRLKLRGFLGVSLLGKTRTFDPIGACNENILKMIRNAGLVGTPCDQELAGER